MTTDRTAAPARSTALTERSPAAGRTPAAPADAFSALLGAVAPRTDEAPRKAEPRRDDASRADHPKRDDAPRETGDTQEPTAPAADAPAIDAPVEPETAPRLVTPDLFALQLASPLPPAAPVAPAPVAEPTAATPVLPAFAPTQLSITAAAQAAVPVTGEAATEPVAATPATPAPVPTLPVLSGLTPASAVAAETTPAVTEQAAVQAQPQVQTAPTADVTPEQIATALQNATAGQTSSDAQPQEQPNTAAPAPTAAPQQAKPAETAPAATTPAPQPVAAPAPAAPVTAPPSLERAVPLYRAVQTTGTLLHVAAERGVTHARLNLKPVELGGIEVRLQSTPQGISAQLVADSPEAARMLAQASDDLRRQLAERDVTLLSLDVSTSSDQRHQAAGGFGADGFGDDYRPGAGTNHRTGNSSAEPTDAAPAPAETTLVLPGGVLVDVLA